MRNSSPIQRHKRSGLIDRDALASSDRAVRTAAEVGSNMLLERCQAVFRAHAERSGKSFEDCRLLLVNGVRP